MVEPENIFDMLNELKDDELDCEIDRYLKNLEDGQTTTNELNTECIKDPKSESQLINDSPQPVKLPPLEVSIVSEEEASKVEGDILRLRKAIEANEKMAQSLDLQLVRIAEAKKRNESLRKQVMVHLQKKSSNKSLFIHNNKLEVPIPASQYFTNEYGESILINPHTELYSQIIKYSPVSIKDRPWNNIEVQSLVDAVRIVTQKKAQEKILESEDFDPSKLEQVLNPSFWDVEIAAHGLDISDWENVCKLVKGRTAWECRLCWFNNASPIVSHNKWTRDEEKNLLKIAQQNNCYNWSKIACELGTHRTAISCMMKYMRSCARTLDFEWTEKEDIALKEAVSKYGESNWQCISQIVNPGRRTGPQCLHRWKNSPLNPNVSKERWTAEEDCRLYLAQHAYDQRWIRVSNTMPHRTDSQCRERWTNILDPTLTKASWTPEEDMKLMEAVQTHGVGKWSRVAKLLCPRTDSQCAQRWKSLVEKDQYEKQRVSTVMRRKLAPPVTQVTNKEKSHLFLEDLMELGVGIYNPALKSDLPTLYMPFNIASQRHLTNGMGLMMLSLDSMVNGHSIPNIEAIKIQKLNIFEKTMMPIDITTGTSTTSSSTTTPNPKRKRTRHDENASNLIRLLYLFPNQPEQYIRRFATPFITITPSRQLPTPFLPCSDRSLIALHRLIYLLNFAPNSPTSATPPKGNITSPYGLPLHNVDQPENNSNLVLNQVVTIQNEYNKRQTSRYQSQLSKNDMYELMNVGNGLFGSTAIFLTTDNFKLHEYKTISETPFQQAKRKYVKRNKVEDDEEYTPFETPIKRKKRRNKTKVYNNSDSDDESNNENSEDSM
eukprot:NODE_466_length_2720_cov_40.181363_g399_i0.p1 GENE.NODE_466_length_2720_cov_40.181363_g399_i0~~NODE_466_length_2720_cov_40.181363_g399_i0.p1  ORF type:complete len:830 (+),score=156.73 NODE_466_length_2720_cov_40.181363_g399_i0:79-2568(+)